MNHEVSIIHDEKYLARSWGAVCTCGHIAACVSEAEAIENKKIHLEQTRHEATAGSNLPEMPQENGR